LQNVGQALRCVLQGDIPALPALLRPRPARPGRHQGLLGRNRRHRGLSEEVADSRGRQPARDPARDARQPLSLPGPTVPPSAPLLTPRRPVMLACPPGRCPVTRLPGYGLTMTLPTAPLSAARWAAAMSASG